MEISKMFARAAITWIGVAACTNYVFAVPANREGDLGIGVTIGDAATLTGKFWASKVHAFELSGGGNYQKESFAQLSFLHHFLSGKESIKPTERVVSEMAPYIGVGAGIGFNRVIQDIKTRSDYFIRAPLGLSWLPQTTRIDLFAEIAPSYLFSPDGIVFLSGSVGGRYYF